MKLNKVEILVYFELCSLRSNSITLYLWLSYFVETALTWLCPIVWWERIGQDWYLLQSTLILSTFQDWHLLQNTLILSMFQNENYDVHFGFHF